MPDINNLADRYTWEAERDTGAIVQSEDDSLDPARTAGDLTGCVRYSLTPAADDPFPLPRIDLAGVPLKRRFGRGFLRVNDPGKDEYVHCIVCAGFRIYVRCTGGGVIVVPEDYELYL